MKKAPFSGGIQTAQDRISVIRNLDLAALRSLLHRDDLQDSARKAAIKRIGPLSRPMQKREPA